MINTNKKCSNYDTLVILLVGIAIGWREVIVSWGRDIGEGGVVRVVVAVLDLKVYIQKKKEKYKFEKNIDLCPLHSPVSLCFLPLGRGHVRGRSCNS